STHSAVDNFERYLVRFDLLQRIDDRFYGALSISFNHDLEDFRSAGGELIKKIFESDLRAIGFLAESLGLHCALFAERASSLFVFHDAEFQTGFRHAVEPENLHCHRRTGFFEPLALLIDKRSDAPIILTANNDVADSQSSFSNQHGR